MEGREGAYAASVGVEGQIGDRVALAIWCALAAKLIWRIMTVIGIIWFRLELKGLNSCRDYHTVPPRHKILFTLAD